MERFASMTSTWMLYCTNLRLICGRLCMISISPPSCCFRLIRSTTSSDAASLPEALSSVPSSLSHSTTSLAPPSPSPSPAFLRPRPANQQSRAKRLSHLFLRGRSNSDRDRAIGEREREIWVHSATPSSHHYLPPASSNAPGLVKIYGDALSSGANYRSLLANINSTARQLIQQVIIRYTERERENESEDTGISFPVMVTQSSQSVFCKNYSSVTAWPQLSKFKKAS